MAAFPLPLDLAARGLWALAIIAAGVAVYFLLNRVILFRAGKNSVEQDSNLPLPHDGSPVIVYFTTPSCAPCKTIQRPALQRLQERLGSRLHVIEINAEERPDLASQWGVLSVPTTFILDPDGRPRYVNHGTTRAETLYRQLEEIN